MTKQAFDPRWFDTIFIDLDGTLISTASGDTFPRFIGDLKFLWPTLATLRVLNFHHDEFRIFIITNQAGVSLGYLTPEAVKAKLTFIEAAVRDYIKSTCNEVIIGSNFAPDYDDRRKPGTLMLEEICNQHNYTDKSKMLMVGDMDADEECAKNFGITYTHVVEFWKFGTQFDPNR
jgi:HAD superfamily hydrolase (TIGR01662 family)